MNNGKKYRELIDKIERAKTNTEKLDLLAVLIFLIASNDLESIYKHIKRLWIGLGIILVSVLFVNSNLGEKILTLLIRNF